MYRKATPLFLISQTPMHAGSGSDLGIVDMPIQRERHTSFPKIEASSFKGAIREAEERKILSELKDDKSNLADIKTKIKNLNICFGFDDAKLNEVFTSNELKELFTEYDKNGKLVKVHSEFAGALGFSDARLLLFPVKSMKGVFAWITCPKVLKQFAEDLKLSELPTAKLDEVLRLSPNQKRSYVSFNSDLTIERKKDNVSIKSVVLEEYSFEVEEKQALSDFGYWLSTNVFDSSNLWKDKILFDIVLLSNDDFKDFVNLSTEVITRTKIDNETGTVQTGALFTEEYLPAESIMYSLVLTANEFKAGGLKETDIKKFFDENLPTVVQIGGNASLGKGIVNTKFLK